MYHRCTILPTLLIVLSMAVTDNEAVRGVDTDDIAATQYCMSVCIWSPLHAYNNFISFTAINCSSTPLIISYHLHSYSISKIHDNIYVFNELVSSFIRFHCLLSRSLLMLFRLLLSLSTKPSDRYYALILRTHVKCIHTGRSHPKYEPSFEDLQLEFHRRHQSNYC